MGLILFKLLLILSFVLLVYTFFFRMRSRLFQRLLFMALAVFSVVMILLPDLSTARASVFGIGRGVDFIIYVAPVVVFFALVVLYRRPRELDEHLSEVVRSVALLTARPPEGHD